MAWFDFSRSSKIACKWPFFFQEWRIFSISQRSRRLCNSSATFWPGYWAIWVKSESVTCKIQSFLGFVMRSLLEDLSDWSILKLPPLSAAQVMQLSTTWPAIYTIYTGSSPSPMCAYAIKAKKACQNNLFGGFLLDP